MAKALHSHKDSVELVLGPVEPASENRLAEYIREEGVALDAALQGRARVRVGTVGDTGRIIAERLDVNTQPVAEAFLAATLTGASRKGIKWAGGGSG